MRLGTWYRRQMIPLLGIGDLGDRALEVGCYDGLLLGGLDARVRVGVDLEPSPRCFVPLVVADGCRLPFASGSFDAVLAFDILEHVADDRALLDSVWRVLGQDGVLWLTTPSEQFRLSPRWMGQWLQARWGHLRVGYSPSQIRQRLPAGLNATVLEWNEPLFRFLWAPLRVLWWLVPPLARSLVSWVAREDGRRRAGMEGHYVVRVCRTPAEGIQQPWAECGPGG
jgi:SAM-dependent methyltransferase